MTRGIAIVGGNGSGKTTLGKALAQRLGWKALDAEDYWFAPSPVPFSYPRTREEATGLLLADIQKHRHFVFSSVNCDYGKEINRHYRLVLYLQVPYAVRMERIRQRAFARFGSRILEGGDLYEQEEQFFQFAASRSLEKTDNWVKTLSCPVLYLDGCRSVFDNVEAVIAFWDKQNN